MIGSDELGLDALSVILAFSLPSLAVASLPAVLIPFAVVMTRRGTEARSILIAAGVVSVIVVRRERHTCGAGRPQGRPISAGRILACPDGHGGSSTARSRAIRRELTVEITRPDQRRARADRNQFLFHSIAARAMGTFAFALIGIGLARKRGWRLLLWPRAHTSYGWCF
jgi:hypothetical protein